MTSDLRFTTLNAEIAVDRLPVDGTIPLWLTGTLLRNGPGKFEVGAQKYQHWFDGLAMLHKFGFANGTVSYANKYLTGHSYTEAQKTGKISYAEFGTDPCSTVFGRVATLFTHKSTDNAVVNITRMAGEFVAMTEIPIPIAFDPHTLQTLGMVEFTDALPAVTATAHPHFDFERRHLLNVATQVGRKNGYAVYCTDEQQRRRVGIANIAAKELSYMHTFALTPRYIILIAFPLIFTATDLLVGVLKGRSFAQNFRWDASRGTRFVVISREDGTQVGTFESAASFAFHQVNAFERDNDIILDFAAYPDAQIVQALYLDNLRRPQPNVPQATLHRYSLRLHDKTVTAEEVATVPLELPRINYQAHNGRDYRYVYGTSEHDGIFLSQLTKIDVSNGAYTVWNAPDCYPGEPVFVAAPNATREDEGVVLSVVLDGAHDNAFLLVLDGQSFAEIGRATVPHHIPLGFHGAYFAD